MSGALPSEIYEARYFWIVTDTEGASWIVPSGAAWSQRKPYRGGVRGVRRADGATEQEIVRQLVHPNLSIAA
jgi:hypothetical protein